MQRRHFLQAAAAATAGFGGAAQAQAWPARPVKLVVPFPAGSSPDIMGRLLADRLTPVLGQPVVVDNRSGAGGNLGAGVVSNAAPDGYTFLFSTQGPLVTAPLLVKRLSYDPVKDLAPVTLAATSPNVLVVDPRLGVNTVAEFVQLVKSKKGELNYGSIGNGSAAHLAMELFKARAGLDMVHVPYQGLPQVVNAILAGQIHAGFMVPGAAIGQVRAGKLKALGVTTLNRVASLPELPTLVEQGYPGFEAIAWQAVLAPARTPQPVIDRLSSELVRIIKSDDVRTTMLGQYFTAVGTAPAALTSLMKSEREQWARVIKAAGVLPE
ncbi:Bug family tripartite tricarboxylate transporter substrate binding protein [Variovorax terrae]|uniref:Tripartite tricarboxylate transporter substrate binding protein n=1 Tax=Variovorax terrae TaxID=2923278 RepID=A0A9X2AQD9_9BURK|nr:tripartite tricarboxylate transporter substrate binding protein [Variovorax terrae]MCJ0765905.1 tripartite tricarboxylate transporter substrate binding protein [Variovorax terrae]